MTSLSILMDAGRKKLERGIAKRGKRTLSEPLAGSLIGSHVLTLPEPMIMSWGWYGWRLSRREVWVGSQKRVVSDGVLSVEGQVRQRQRTPFTTVGTRRAPVHMTHGLRIVARVISSADEGDSGDCCCTTQY